MPWNGATPCCSWDTVWAWSRGTRASVGRKTWGKPMGKRGENGEMMGKPWEYLGNTWRKPENRSFWALDDGTYEIFVGLNQCMTYLCGKFEGNCYGKYWNESLWLIWENAWYPILHRNYLCGLRRINKRLCNYKTANGTINHGSCWGNPESDGHGSRHWICITNLGARLCNRGWASAPRGVISKVLITWQFVINPCSYFSKRNFIFAQLRNFSKAMS